MKIRRLSAAAMLAAALGTAVLAGASPASAAPWLVKWGPYATLEQCQVQRDKVAQIDPTSDCRGVPGNYYFYSSVQ
ncbi:hypothetical protein ACFQ08_03620 [Streptosporangium algeriense]|uniref:Uncharacterized protein n=1 Tax=Streptosporangium algeriense TaxID=1682748 RepID=A0ABW3DIT9_9ACTN